MSKYATIKTKQQFGTVISFKKSGIYGTVEAPESDNITVDLNDAKLGVIIQIIHNSSITPTFPTSFELRGGGVYITDETNYINCQYINPTKVVYTIL